MRDIARLLISSALIAILASCSSSSVADYEPQNNSAFAQNLLANINSDSKSSQEEATNSLVRSASSVSNSLRKLAEIERAVHPNAYLAPAPEAAKIGMDNLASVDWHGPAEPLLTKLAKSSQYKFNSIGKQPTIPVLVAINCQNKTIVEIIRDVGFQIQRSASITILPAQKLVELRYNQ